MHFFRHPKTTQERRWSYADWDGQVHIRHKRRAKAIPSAWDELMRSHLKDRNWKRFRRHQWKVR